MRGRVPRPVAQRLSFLLAANGILLGLIWLLLKQGSSFASVLQRASPDVAPIVLAGLGMTGIVFTGAIDLSIASVVALAATVFGLLVAQGAPPFLCYAICVAAAWLLSLVNAQLIHLLRVPAIIVTLAGLPLYRGLALIIADVGIPRFAGNISVHEERFHAPGKLYVHAILLAACVAAVLWDWYGRTPRTWLALGSSEEACRLAGLSPKRIRVSAFAAAGFFLGLASLVYVTRVQSIEPARIALGFELQVIGAVVLGGTNIFGGEGSLLGTILGAFFLYFISQALVYAGASPYFQDAIAGVVIILVIGIDCALHRRRRLLEELS